MSFCCPNCFKDDFLGRQIIQFSNNKGKCDYCNNSNVDIVETIVLQDLFEEIIDIYIVSENGIKLSEILDSDWKMFNIDKYAANDLLSEILRDKKILTQNYINILEKTSSDVWDNFKKELKYNNRYFPYDSEFDKDSLKEISQYFETIKYPNRVFRARVCKDNKIIPIERMGKPPKGQLTQGRANPVGISYLYVASDKETAVSEIRPHKGDKITISEIQLPNNLRFLDIRSPKNTISPFEFSDNILEALFKDIDLLERFGEELSKPVLPREAGIEYLSSQYLSELIKHWGFDGMLYKSSVGTGFNIVIFTDMELEFIDNSLYNIDSLSIKFKHLDV